MRNCFTVALLFAIGLLFGQAFRAPAQTEKAPLPVALVRWEYKVIPLDESQLKKLSAERWELFTTTTEFHSRPGPTGIGEISSQPRLILRRQRQ